MTAQSYTSRTLPAPWGVCEVCGGTHPALPDLDNLQRCPECSARARLHDAAALHLAQLLAPSLGAWAHYYKAQGMNQPALLHALEEYTGGGLNARAQTEHLTGMLGESMAQHVPPSFTLAPPDRVQFDARTLPQLLTCKLDPAREKSDGPGQIDRRLSFTVRLTDGRVSEVLTLGPGRDASLILNTNPDAEALLCYTGMDGQRSAGYPGEVTAYRVPAHLLPQVKAALGYWGKS